MVALLQYLKHWFQSLFSTVKHEFNGTVKKEEVVKIEEVVEKEIAKDVSKILEVLGVTSDAEVKVTSDEGTVTEIKEEKVSEVKSCKPHRSNKLTMDQARAIRADRHIKTIKELSVEYSVSVDTIKRILDNKTYKEC